jgi:D-alanyl-D-alanine carboxypeptidase
VFAGVLGLSAAMLVGLASPAEAKRRHARGSGGYNPPYADMVVDVKTGRVLHAVNEDALRHPASVTKVMTLYLLFEQLERGRVALDTPLRVSAHASRQAPSKLGLRPGDTIAVEDAIKALVTKSANDVAVVIAENIGGSEEDFAEQMTRKARSLGMSQTVYRNASGLPDSEQVTTAKDLTVLARAIQDRFPRYYAYFQTRVFHYAGAAHRNHNKLLGRVEGVDGIKTGFTRDSGFNLMTSARTEDRHIVAIVLGGRSGASRDQTMAALVRSNLPRAYAGLRTTPAIADASDRPRPAVVAEVTPRVRVADADPTSTTGAVVPRPKNQPLDLNAMRPVAASAGPTTTPRWTATPQPTPHGAMAYAALPASEPTEQSAPLSLSPHTTTGKLEARLPAVDPIVIARSEPTEVKRGAPLDTKREVSAEPKREATPEAKREPAEPRREAARPTSPWVIQLGALDDEDKAKSILADARSRSGRMLAHAAPFTEKVVREGATLYRARFSGFAEPDEAQDACKVLKRSGFNCFATRS